MAVSIVEGDLLVQNTQVIVNPWNRNIIPWWLLIPHGVSGAIKKHAGVAPFRELAKYGPMMLGQALPTAAGKLPFKCIIHVASIDLLWRASEQSIYDSVRNAMTLVELLGHKSIAFPVLGAGSGGFDAAAAEAIMMRAFADISSLVECEEVLVVRFNDNN